VKVDRKIEPRGTEPPRQAHVIEKAAPPALRRRYQNLVDVLVERDDRQRGRLDQVRNPRIREELSNPSDCRRRKDDVADLS
jgi:hypothetical protein